MAKGFNLTAQINLQGPNNLKVIVADIKRQLGTVGADVKIKLGPEAAKSINSVTTRLKSMNDILVTAKNNTDSLSVSLSSLSSSLSGIGNAGSKTTTAITKTASGAKTAAQNIKQATTEMEAFGKQSALAIRRFAAFSVVSGAIYKLVNAINSGFAAFVSFDKQLVKLQQVTGKGAMGLKGLENQITSLATSLGVSSESLIEVASTLAQAGLSAEETRIALAALAKTELAPSFDSLTETTEGAIAALRQFELSAGDLEAALGSINAVAAAFAVESSDIITAIQRTGGVFAAASKGVSEGKDALNEFIAVFTSVRATTRESAETIATGLRTIFTRIQRGKTIEQLKDFGIILTDLEGKFVGPFEAIKRLSEGLRTLDPRDLRFSQIVEELGGFRQIGKVIPLIQQFAEAQKALKVAQAGQSSLTDAQLTAQKSLANQIAKVREQFLALIRDIGKTNTFKAITSIVLNLASSFISLASAFKPILPFLAILGTIKGIKAIGEFGTGFFGGLKSSSGGSTAKNIGSNIGSTISGSKEQERAATTKLATDAIQSNTSALKSLTTAVSTLENTIKSRGSTTFSSGGKVLGFNSGGIVPGSGKGDKIPALLEPGEVVINNRAANKYGRGNLASMNKYVDGGKINITAKELKARSRSSKAIENLITDDADKGSYASGRSINTLDNISFNRRVYKLYDMDSINDWSGFEESVQKRVGGTRTNIGKNDPSFPIDIVGSNFGPLEVRNRIESTSNRTLLDKLIRYYISKQEFSRFKNQPSPDDISLGNIGVVYNSAKYDPPNAKELNLGGIIKKYAIGGKTLGARSKLKQLTEEEIGQLSTPDLIAYGRALAKDIFSTKGAGIATANEFIEVPPERIVPELESSLVNYMGKRGFWREKVSPLGRELKNNSKQNNKLNKQQSLESQAAKYTDEVAARNQDWTKIQNGSKIDTYLLSTLTDPILSDYKTVKNGKSLAKPFHNTRLRQAVNKALDNYDDFDYSSDNINKLISGIAAKKFASGGLIQKFVNAGEVKDQTSSEIEQILKKINEIGGPGRAKQLIGLSTIEQAVKSIVTSGKKPRARNIFDKDFLKKPDAIPFIPTISDLLDQATIAFSESTAADFKLTPEQIASAKNVAIAGFQTDMKDLKSYYRLRKGVPLHVHTGIIKPDKYSIIDKLLEKQHIAQVEAAQELAPDATITPLKKEDRQKFGESNLGGYNLEAILALLGSGNGKKTTQDAIDFANGLTPLAASVFGVPAGIPTQAKLTISSSNVTKALDGIIKTFAFGGKADGPGFEEVKKQIIDKYPEIDFRISKRKRGFGYMIQGGLSPAEKHQVDFASNLSDLSKVSDQMAQDILYNYGPKIDPSLLKKLQKKKQFAVGGLAEASGEMSSLMSSLYGNRQSGTAQETKKQKNFGKIGLRNTGTEITATYFKNAEREGFVSAKKMGSDLYTVGLSKASKGYGPRLYDIVMEAATAAGGMLTSDRNQVSNAAKSVWAYYFNNRSDVKKTPLDPSQWTKNQSNIDPKLYGKKETWPPFNDPAWILQTGYSKAPELINSSDIINMNDPKYAQFLQQQQLSFMTQAVLDGNMRSNGGVISKFASGGTVPAMVSSGEAFVPPKLAKKIGYGKLHKMNQADRNGMKGFSGGGISVFKGPGSGTSDSIGPIGLPEGSFIIREKATKALGLNKGGYVGLAAGGFPELTPEMAAMVKGIQKSTTQKYSKQYKAAPSITLAGSNDLNKEQVKLVAQAEYETAAMKAIVESIKLTKDQRDNINKLQQEITAKYQDEYNSATDAADKAAIKAKAQIEYTTQAREQVFGSAKPTVTKPETLPKIDISGKNQYADEKGLIQYKARKAGMGEGEYKRSLAAKVADTATSLQRDYSGRKEEFKQSLVARRESFQGIDRSTDVGAAQFNTAVTELAKEIQDLNPELKFDEARAAAEKLANDLSKTGEDAKDVGSMMNDLRDSIPEEISATKAVALAKRQVAKAEGLSEGTLGRTVSSKEIKREQFIRSPEGQRFGRLAEFAPGLTEKFSKTGVGQALGKAADFTSGKGGRFSKLFAGAGGFQGIGSGLAVGSEALKNSGLISKDTLKNPNVAGAFGAVQGAGVMGATGAELGSQLGGPIGALIGGIGGAIIGGIKGFFDAKNAQVLQNALDKLTKSSEAVDVAFKELAKNDTDKNFKNVQKAFGQQIEASKELESIAFSDGGSDAMSGLAGGAIAGAGLGAAGGALVGSFVPIIGNAVGAAIGGALGGIAGGITGYLSSQQSKANKEEAIKGRIGAAGAMNEGAARMAERQMGRMTTEQLTQVGTGGTNVIADQYKQSAIAAAEAADSEKKLTSQQKEKIGQNAIDSAYLDAYMKQRKEAGATDQQITDDILKDRKTALLAGKQALDSQQEAAKKQQLLARATKEVALATENLLDVYRRVGANAQRFSDEIDDMLGNTKATTSSLRGNAALRDVDRSGSERVLGNMAAYSTEEVRAATQEMVGKLGGGEEAQALGKQAEAAKFLQDKLPGMLRNENADPQQIMSDIRSEMKDMGIDGGAVDKMLSEIEKQISDNQKGGLGTLADEISAGGIDKFSMTAAEAAKTLQNLSKTYNDTLQKSIDLQNAYNESVMQSNSFLRKAGTIRLNAELDLSRALGNSPTLAQLNEPFDFEVRDLTKGLVPGGTTDPAQIAAGIVAKTEENKTLEEAKKAIGNEGMQGVSAADQGAELLAKNQELGSAIGSNVVAINEGRQALEKLANDGSKAANALAKIEEQQRQIEGLGNRFEKIFTASPEELFKMNKQSAALSAAQQGGSELFKSRAFRQDAFAGLEQDKEFLTPEEFRKQRGMLMRKSFEAQGYTGESMVQKGGIQMTLDELIKRIEGGMPSEEDPNVKAYREAVSTQIAANKELAKLEEIASLGIQESMLDLQDFLAKEFPKILTDAVTASKTDAETKPETGASKPEKSEKQKQAELDIGIAEENIKSSKNVINGLDRRIKGTKDPKELKRLRAERDKEQSSMYNQLGNIITARGVISQEQSKAKAKEEETKAAQVAAEQKTKEEKVSSSMQTANTALAQGQQPPQPGSREARRKALEARKAEVMAQPAVQPTQPTTAATPAEVAKTAQQAQPAAQVKPTSVEPPKRDFKAEKAVQFKKLRELRAKVETGQASMDDFGEMNKANVELSKIKEEEQTAKTTAKTQKREDYLLKQNPRTRQRLMTKAEKEAGLGEKLAQREAEMAAKTEQTTSTAPVPAPTPPGAAAPSPQDKAKTEKASQEVMTTGSLPTAQATTPQDKLSLSMDTLTQSIDRLAAIYSQQAGVPQTPTVTTNGPIPITKPLTPETTTPLTPTGSTAAPTGETTGTMITIDPASLEGLASFNKTFGEYVNQLVSFSFPPIEGKVDINHKLEVNMTGAASIASLDKHLKDLAVNMITPKLQELESEIKKSIPSFRTSDTRGSKQNT